LQLSLCIKIALWFNFFSTILTQINIHDVNISYGSPEKIPLIIHIGIGFISSCQLSQPHFDDASDEKVKAEAGEQRPGSSPPSVKLENGKCDLCLEYDWPDYKSNSTSTEASRQIREVTVEDISVWTEEATQLGNFSVFFVVVVHLMICLCF